MSSTLFISDLHLDPDRPATVGALTRFLGAHTDCKALYILGDLFEAWIGDDDDAPLAQQIATALRTFSDAGPSLYLMRGNRDFLLGESYAARCGATLLHDPTVIDLYGKPTLLMHGDSLCTSDTDYLAYREDVREPLWQKDILGRPLEERRQLARQMRIDSASASSNKPEDIMDVTQAEVERIMEEYQTPVLIHGHTHRPAGHQEATGYRWVLGDWDVFGWFIESTPGGNELVKFNIIQ